MRGGQDYSRALMDALPDGERRLLLERMSAELTARTSGAGDFGGAVEEIIGELRALGHDLYLFDSDGEWQVWCGDWTAGGGAGKLILRFAPGEGVEAEWGGPD